jgi:STE24 endopeptidase
VGHALDDLAAQVSGARWWRVAVVVALVGLGHAVLAFPLEVARGFWLPRRHGLLHQPFRAWLADRAKAALLSGTLALLAVELIYGLLAVTSLWWLAAAAVFFVAGAGLATLVPTWILPLFYRLTPLADAGLAARLLALARRAGVSALGVWVADHSRKSRTANAALVGLGRTRRIVLFDTLLAEFTPDEVESVLAHELGHHVHRDIARGLLAQGVLTLVTFWVADRLIAPAVSRLGLDGPADPAGVPWVALVLALLGLAAAPLANAFSRRLERQADDFALAALGDTGAFVAALERLGRLNLAERRPHPVKEFLLHSHPSLEHRIARARRRPAPPRPAALGSA